MPTTRYESSYYEETVQVIQSLLQTNFEDGEILLTTHRLLWGKPGEIARGMTALSLKLKYVMAIDEETASSMLFSTKQRIILHLSQPASGCTSIYFM